MAALGLKFSDLLTYYVDRQVDGRKGMKWRYHKDVMSLYVQACRRSDGEVSERIVDAVTEKVCNFSSLDGCVGGWVCDCVGVDAVFLCGC